jgi:hypothetical protein
LDLAARHVPDQFTGQAMPKAHDPTFQLRHCPLPKLVVDCIKCGRNGRFDKAQLVQKLGNTYPVHQAVDRVTRNWQCEKPDRMPAYALHPNAMYYLPHLPDWQGCVNRFFFDLNYGRKPEPLYATPEMKAPPA